MGEGEGEGKETPCPSDSSWDVVVSIDF